MTDQPPKQPETGPKTERQIDTSGWHRPDVLGLDPPNCLLLQNQIIVIRYPKVEQSKGGIIYDARSHHAPKCLAWVVKSSTFPIERGDTVLVPEHMFALPIELIDVRAFVLDVTDVVLLYPDPKNPLEKRQPPKGQEDEA